MLQKIIVLYNKPTNIKDFSDTDTELSAIDTAKALSESGYEVSLMSIEPKEIKNLKKIKTDLVFNLIEWSGKNSNYSLDVVRELEKTEVSYTGSSAYGLELSCDKKIMKKVFLEYKVPTPRWMIADVTNGLAKKFALSKLEYPVILKPTKEHCGIGITQDSVVRSEAELIKQANIIVEELNSSVLIEEYIEGREVHVSVLEKSGKPWVLPPSEVTFSNKTEFNHILTYAAKWMEDADEYPWSGMTTAKLSPKIITEINRLVEKYYTKLGMADYSRLDIRLRGDELFILEVNNNPGIDFDDLSGIGVSAKRVGFETYPELVSHIAKEAYGKKHKIREVRSSKRIYASAQI